jgi:hypothetical protein
MSDSRPATNRRRILQSLGVSTVGLASMSRGGAQAAPGVELAAQTAYPDNNDTDDFPVPDAYRLTLGSVAFQNDTGTIALPVANSDGQPGVGPDDTFWYEAQTDENGDPLPAFVVGLHSPNVGNGQPNSLSSLIGVRPFLPGAYADVPIPVWQGPPPWQQSLGATPDQFPSGGDTLDVTATIWYGPDVFPPIADRDSNAAIAQTPNDEQNGPVSANGSLVTSTASVEFVDLPPLPGQTNAPKDLDGDGRYEDVNGDGAVDILDVQLFFENLGNDAVQNNAEVYDFSGTGGQVSIFDVQALFNRATTQ